VTLDVRAEELPELRADLVQFLRSPFGRQVWGAIDPHTRFVWPPGTPEPSDRAEALSILRNAEIERLLRAELYCVTTDMTGLVLQASQSLPCYRLHPEDVPASAGLCVWLAPVGETLAGAPIHAVSWSDLPGRGVWLGWYALALSETLRRLEFAGASPEQIAQWYPRGLTFEGRETLLPYGEAPRIDARNRETGEDSTVLCNALLTTWLIMSEPYVSSSTVQLDRALGRRPTHHPAPLRGRRRRRSADRRVALPPPLAGGRLLAPAVVPLARRAPAAVGASPHPWPRGVAADPRGTGTDAPQVVGES
jgi:hypothetical protein